MTLKNRPSFLQTVPLPQLVQYDIIMIKLPYLILNFFLFEGGVGVHKHFLCCLLLYCYDALLMLVRFSAE